MHPKNLILSEKAKLKKFWLPLLNFSDEISRPNFVHLTSISPYPTTRLIQYFFLKKNAFVI